MSQTTKAPYLLVSDVDDTLVGDEAALTRFAHWYRSLRSQLRLAYASGRFADSIFTTIHSTALPAPDAIIGGVGTEIRHYPSLKFFEQWEQRMSANWSGQRVRDLLQSEAELEIQPERFQSRFKISYYLHDAPPARLEELITKLRDAGIDADYIYSSDRDLDFTPRGVNKGSAACFLAEHWGYDADHVLVSGNSANDAALYEHGFRGIVVANAHDELKQLADDRIYLSGKPLADGVQDGLEHWTRLSPESAPAAERDFDGKDEEDELLHVGYQRAIELMRDCRTAHGFIASTVELANYRRVWGRDSCIMGIAALMSGDSDLIKGCRDSLLTLAHYQGPHGEIPSNVDPETDRISYGGTAGRVDADLWFVIACGQYWRATGDHEFLERVRKPLERVRFLLGCWQFNARGLLYIPMTGDWADEYVHSGYVLYDQLLYLQALYELCDIHQHLHESRDHALDDQHAHLKHLITTNYWFEEREAEGGETPDDVYHHVLFEKGREAKRHQHGTHWLPYFSPAGYGYRFDSLANVLASLLGVASDEQRGAVDQFVEEQIANKDVMLLPAFYPVITAKDEAWEDLQMMFSYTFKNQPYEYHNGGLWPMVTGFYAADLALRGKTELARQYLKGVHLANAREHSGNLWSFPEFIHGKHLTADGTAQLGWSAAGAIIAHHALQGTAVFSQSLPKQAQE